MGNAVNNNQLIAAEGVDNRTKIDTQLAFIKGFIDALFFVTSVEQSTSTKK